MRSVATGRVLHDPRTGTAFRFDAGALCLDFAHSGGEGPYAVFESLHTPDDLGRWLAEPPLSAAVTAPVTDDDLRDARRLRQAIWEAAQARAAGEPLPGAAVDVVNRAAAAPALVPRLEPAGAGPGGPGADRAAWAAPVTTAQALSTLAREMIEVLTGPLAQRMRTCASDDCPLVFVDTSRPNARRWCSMERCGNRQKVKALRARRREAVTPHHPT
jgi:predicted RNA-binding Zn ribbon-like protein